MLSVAASDAVLNAFRGIQQLEIEKAIAEGRDAKHFELLRLRACMG